MLVVDARSSEKTYPALLDVNSDRFTAVSGCSYLFEVMTYSMLLSLFY